MKILTKKQIEYLFTQLEVREEMIDDLVKIADYYREEVDILLEMLDNDRKSIERVGVKITNKDVYFETVGEAKKLNNLMEERLNVIKKVTRKGEE